MECCSSFLGVVLTDDKRLACGKICLDLFLGQRQAVLVVYGDLLTVHHLGLQGSQSLLITEAIICLALIDQLLGIFHIDTGLHTLTLHVRTIAAVLIGSLIMYQSGLLQSTVDDLGSAFHIALLVGILDTEHEISAGMLCNQKFI